MPLPPSAAAMVMGVPVLTLPDCLLHRQNPNVVLLLPSSSRPSQSTSRGSLLSPSELEKKREKPARVRDDAAVKRGSTCTPVGDGSHGHRGEREPKSYGHDYGVHVAPLNRTSVEMTILEKKTK